MTTRGLWPIGPWVLTFMLIVTAGCNTQLVVPPVIVGSDLRLPVALLEVENRTPQAVQLLRSCEGNAVKAGSREIRANAIETLAVQPITAVGAVGRPPVWFEPTGVISRLEGGVPVLYLGPEDRPLRVALNTSNADFCVKGRRGPEPVVYRVVLEKLTPGQRLPVVLARGSCDF